MATNLRHLLSEHYWIIVLCFSFMLLGSLRLNDISLYTDSTRYVILGTSFAHARGFVDDTQPDPERYVVNAPFYSVVLSPVLLFFPLSLLAAKLWTLFACTLFVVAFYRLLMKYFSKGLATLGAVLVAWNPLMVLLATEVLSESVFLLFLAIVLIMLERLKDGTPLKDTSFLVLIGLTSVIVLLREVAIPLVGAVVVFFLWRKEYRKAILVLGCFSVLFGAWLYRNLVLIGAPPVSQATNINFVFEHFLTPPQSSFLKELALRFVHNFQGYAVHLGGLLFFPVPEVLIVEPSSLFQWYFRMMAVLKFVIPVIFLPLFFSGVWHDLNERHSSVVRILFIIGYLLIILLYPVYDVRFLLPLLPLAVFYSADGFTVIVNRWLRRDSIAPRTVGFILVGLVAIPNLLCIFELDRTNIQYAADPIAFSAHLREAGINKALFAKPWSKLGDAIRAHTPADCVIAGAAKEASIFIGDRKLLELNNGVPVTTFDSYLRKYAVEYVMATVSWADMETYEFQMGESRRFWFEPFAQVAGMQLYKVHPTFLSPREVWVKTKRFAIDTSSAAGLLRLGRGQLVRGQYDDAIATLQHAAELSPGQALVASQLVIAYAMKGQVTEASNELQRLYGLPQSQTYIPVAARHVAAAIAQDQAEQSGTELQRTLTAFETATFYWNFGYSAAAYTTIRSLLSQDSTYFSGLLWGWHFAIQKGDTLQAGIYLKSLRKLDPTNPVVQQFMLIEQKEDTLRTSFDPIRRSNLHLDIARSYRAVDLPEESLDEAQRSLLEDPENVQAWVFQGRYFDEMKAPWAACNAYKHALLLDPGNSTIRTSLAKAEGERNR